MPKIRQKTIALSKSIPSKPTIALANTEILFADIENGISFIEIAIAKTKKEDWNTENANRIFIYTHSNTENAIAFTENAVSCIEIAVVFIENAIAFSINEIPCA